MMVKDKGRPKSPMTPFACFVQVIREEHRKKHPSENIIFSEFSKRCGEKWKVMTNEQRKCFEEMAKLDTERFNREMSQYVPPAVMRRCRKRRRIKDPSMPKRSWSAFFFFCDAFRSKIRSEHPEWKVSDIAKELGRRWEECTDKQEYERHAQNDKLRYEQDMQKYKAGVYVATKRIRIMDSNHDMDMHHAAHLDSNMPNQVGHANPNRQIVDEAEDEEDEADDEEDEADEEEEDDGDDPAGGEDLDDDDDGEDERSGIERENGANNGRDVSDNEHHGQKGLVACGERQSSLKQQNLDSECANETVGSAAVHTLMSPQQSQRH